VIFSKYSEIIVEVVILDISLGESNNNIVSEKAKKGI
jgi:hypothetical protein